MNNDNDPRPHKRQRIQLTEKITDTAMLTLPPLPPPVLLLSLPGLLAQPPTHRFHPQALILSLKSLRKCLTIESLAPDVECRTWTALAEVGMNVIDGGFAHKPEHTWAIGIEKEVEKSIGRGRLIAQKHPSLRIYKHHLTLIHARFSHWQQNHKFAHALLRRLLSSFTTIDPPALIYTTHLAIISHLVSARSVSVSQQTVDAHTALQTVDTLHALALQRVHPHVALLAQVLRVQLLVMRQQWALIQPALDAAEAALGLSYVAPQPGAGSSTKDVKDPRRETTFVSFDDPFEVLMAIHTLILGVTFFTSAGLAADASPRLSHLHALLDAGALDHFPDGIVQIAFSTGPPLALRTTHPRVLFFLGYLVSAVSKRDAVGRKPRRKVFAMEGLSMLAESQTPELTLPPWASVGELEEVDQRLARIKADLLSELVAVTIMRSEFDTAEENLAALIAHTRTHDLFPLYAPRITLHHAHLAHALGQSARAVRCYRVAADLADEGTFVRAAARAGEVLLRIGLRGGRFCAEGGSAEDAEIAELGREAVGLCRGMGGTLEAAGHLLSACLSKEIVKSKQHLRQALELASRAQDNHMRALVLALIASEYMDTAIEHAGSILQTCDQLAAGLGAAASKGAGAGDAVAGNAPMRLWVGERVVELWKRTGKEEKAGKQLLVNAELHKAVSRIAERGGRISAGASEARTDMDR